MSQSLEVPPVGDGEDVLAHLEGYLSDLLGSIADLEASRATALLADIRDAHSECWRIWAYVREARDPQAPQNAAPGPSSEAPQQ